MYAVKYFYEIMLRFSFPKGLKIIFIVTRRENIQKRTSHNCKTNRLHSESKIWLLYMA